MGRLQMETTLAVLGQRRRSSGKQASTIVMAMAQWMGQFSGNTHRSKVLDREGQLRHAIEVYRGMQLDGDRTAQAQTVKRLADRLLAARIRAMKATLNAMGPMAPDSPIANSMKTKIQDVTNAGVHAILEEFDSTDILAE